MLISISAPTRDTKPDYSPWPHHGLLTRPSRPFDRVPDAEDARNFHPASPTDQGKCDGYNTRGRCVRRPADAGGTLAASTRGREHPVGQGTDRIAATRPARDGVRRRYERQVDPDNELDPAERARRADSALRAHMQRLAARSSIARRRRSAKL